MGDPERLLGPGAADPQVRELLESLRSIAPAERLAESSWGALALKLAVLPTIVPGLTGAPAAGAGAGGSAAAGGVGTGASKALVLKLLAAAVASTAVSGFAYHVATAEPPQEHPAAIVKVAPVRTPAPASVAATPSTPALVVSAPAPGSAPSEPNRAASAVGQTVTALPGSSAPRASRLEAEASLLAQARSQLRGGDARGALVSLNQLQATFPKGQLSQERDVLTVEVLAASGNPAAAKQKALAFIAAHPTSPHRAKLQRFAKAP